MSLLLSMLAFCGVGIVEWALAMWRTVACAKGRSTVVALIVFCETGLACELLQYLVLGRNHVLIVAYAIGAAIGSKIGSRK